MNGSRTREERLQIMLSPEELAAVDDYRFKRRMPSRAAAVRDLLNRGIASVKGSEVGSGDGVDADAGMKSGDFGVFERGPDGHRSVTDKPE